MEIIMIVCLTGAAIILFAKMLPARSVRDRAGYDREMRVAYAALRDGRMIDRSRSEYTANRQLSGR